MARFDQLVVGDRLDIVGADLLEDVAEQVELLIGIRAGVVVRLPHGGRERQERNGGHRGRQPGFTLHIFHSTLLSLLPSQGTGSIGCPS